MRSRLSMSLEAPPGYLLSSVPEWHPGDAAIWPPDERSIVSSAAVAFGRGVSQLQLELRLFCERRRQFENALRL